MRCRRAAGWCTGRRGGLNPGLSCAPGRPRPRTHWRRRHAWSQRRRTALILMQHAAQACACQFAPERARPGVVPSSVASPDRWRARDADAWMGCLLAGARPRSALRNAGWCWAATAGAGRTSSPGQALAATVPGGLDGQCWGGVVQLPGACRVYLDGRSSRRRRADGVGSWAGIGVAHEQDHDLAHWPGSHRRDHWVRAAGGGADGRLVEQGDRGARPGGPEQGRERPSQLSVVRLRGQLRRRRVLHRAQGFVAVERNGVWGTAIEVPGLLALNAGGAAHVYSMSCAPAGTCAAGGSYRDRHGHYQGFIVSQTG
jgi:hypothetical protein